MKKSSVIIIIVSVVLAAALLAAGGHIALKQYLTSKYETEIEHLNTLLAQKKTEKVVEEKIIEKEVVISGQTIQSGLRNIGELASSEYYFTHVSAIENSQTFYGYTIPFTTAKSIYSYDGVIKAGIDFNEILVDKNDEAKTIVVTIPHARILSSQVDTNSFCLWDEQTNIFTPFSMEDFNTSFSQMLTEEEQKAIDNGLLIRAEENAILMIRNFMSASYNVGDYEITVQIK